ncbi:MAG: photosynthetic complex putative assembly protein PuhB [Lamprobacter sp.]|uniref:photosynthetic complex putative assembly protein PuhB n=1 Tax=Lamprobacter sp. TaxID=3100796 RepID=UPI002B25B2C8|nr:photosynthetic complex putative assembly protein PuhB [Lamprobacter sp.]MEA3639157.1 photosynthetic complex putative assembly protein PuhB [Lamprobacter sp.]
MSEFAFEPVHGLPENLPPGEALRWQGAPHWRVLARRAFYVRTVAFYFGLLMLLRFVYMISSGAGLKEAVLATLWLALLGGLAVGILALLAWLYSRSTVYSITDRRLVIRFGVALPMAVNIPFKIVESAGLRTYPDRSGDIPLVLTEGQSVNYFIMWPNVRPWRFTQAQPMLRSIPEAAKVADLLAEALRSAIAENAEAVETTHAQGMDSNPESKAPVQSPAMEPSAAEAGGQ